MRLSEPSFFSIATTLALSHLHSLLVALDRFASSRTSSFMIYFFAFFHAVKVPDSGQAIG